MEGVNKPTHPDIPGEPTQTGTSLLEKATAAIQGFGPVNKIHQHLCAFHFYSHDMSRQVEAHHYCGHQNEEMRQCLIYDSPEANARLIGIEYIISEELFLTLPDEEKPLWHTHEYEVKSGVLFMPGVPGPIQRKDLEKVCKTYGKTFHFWQIDKGDSLPLGLPQVMMALTRDGQLYDNLAQGFPALIECVFTFVIARFGIEQKGPLRDRFSQCLLRRTFSRIIKLIAVELYCTHTAACIFYYLATTLPAEQEGYTWIGSLKLGDCSYLHFRQIDLWKRYTTSLYFAIVTVSTVVPGIPDSVFCLVDCPHDWLFPQCLAVVHHGGAGTTATGLRARAVVYDIGLIMEPSSY